MNENKRLPEAELEIMLVLWHNNGAQRTAEIQKQLNNGWALSTLKVLLGRLVDREYVECLRNGRLMSYKAAVSEESYRCRETNGLLRRYYKGSAKNLIAALALADGLTQKDLAEISDMLKAKEEK